MNVDELQKRAAAHVSAGEFDEALAILNGLDVVRLPTAGWVYQALTQIIASVPAPQFRAWFAALDPALLLWLLNQRRATCAGVPFLTRNLSGLWRLDPERFGPFLDVSMRTVEAMNPDGELSSAEACLMCLATRDRDREAVDTALAQAFPRFTLVQGNFAFWFRNRLAIDWIVRRGPTLIDEPLSDVAFFNLLTATACYGERETADAVIAAIPSRIFTDPFIAESAHRIAERRHAPTRRPAAAASPLRIALCVSGQLRGYRAAKPTWRSLGLEGCDVDTYVHTWRDLGRKMPVPNHAERSFPRPFAGAFATAAQRLTLDGFWAEYPSVRAVFERAAVIDAPTLSDFYQTDFVVVEDEADLVEVLPTNSHKMYYKIHQCAELMTASGRPYDLVIRIRPDKVFDTEDVPQIDWRAVHAECASDKVVYADGSSLYLPGPGFGCGDQVAVGAPDDMAGYASAWEMQANKGDYYGFPHTYVPHSTLAYACLYNGVLIKNMRTFFPHFQPPVDPDGVEMSIVIDAIARDAEGRNSETDQALLDAAKQSVSAPITSRYDEDRER